MLKGEFANNMFHGYGKYTWPDGSFYEGNFNENKWVRKWNPNIFKCCFVIWMVFIVCFYFVFHRLEGQGTFTDVHSQVWYGNFTHKAAPGLKFKLNTWIYFANHNVTLCKYVQIKTCVQKKLTAVLTFSQSGMLIGGFSSACLNFQLPGLNTYVLS